jgi:hypothetical protein
MENNISNINTRLTTSEGNITLMQGNRSTIINDISNLDNNMSAVKICGFFIFVASGILAPNILVSYTKSKFSVIVLSLQQILNCFMKLPACLSPTNTNASAARAPAPLLE